MCYEMREVLPSAYNIITSNRSIGYTMESAVADIIDNSISAQATQIDILTPPSPESLVCYICDNGTGMDILELDNAMTFGGRDYIEHRKTTDLGRYGLGLKTASLSQCRRFSVITKKNGESIIGGRWDLDVVKSHNEWKYLVLSEQECLKILKNTPVQNYESGTVVLWENFDRLKKSSKGKMVDEFNKQLGKTQDHLELVFHRYLNGESGVERITIKCNGRNLEPNDPFLRNQNPSVVEPIEIPIENERIIVIPHKLIHPSKISRETANRLEVKGSLLNTQGFYVYRNKRLLIWGTWFGLAHKVDKTKLCRVQIDIPNSLDYLWSLDIKKSNAIPPAFLKDQLAKIISNVTNISIRTFEKRIRSTKNKSPYWLRSVIEEKYCKYEINRNNPIAINLKQKMTEEQNLLFDEFLKNLETFLPISQLHVDLQKDYSISNEAEAEISDLHRLDIQFRELVKLGIQKSAILKMEPFCNNRKFIEEKEKVKEK